jgi:hypothetical protein
MRKILPVIIAVGVVGALTTSVPAQTSQTPRPSTAAPSSETRGMSRHNATIDCPPAAAGAEHKSGAVGTPQGAGTGSGLNAMPSVGPPQQLQGEIKAIGSTRTNRTVEVANVKLEVEPDTVILVGCQPGSIAELKEGTHIKASHEVKEPNRNVATVIEAQ